ncbi:MAG: hypothetical protein RR877_03690 [Aurantimicrobium sp.]|uniref:hypothetical protein n=1 Tax=Aurantimicrobium sp. TaxID=1930784 RepID=UPI002FCA4D04
MRPIWVERQKWGITLSFAKKTLSIFVGLVLVTTLVSCASTKPQDVVKQEPKAVLSRILDLLKQGNGPEFAALLAAFTEHSGLETDDDDKVLPLLPSSGLETEPFVEEYKSPETGTITYTLTFQQNDSEYGLIFTGAQSAAGSQTWSYDLQEMNFPGTTVASNWKFGDKTFKPDYYEAMPGLAIAPEIAPDPTGWIEMPKINAKETWSKQKTGVALSNTGFEQIEATLPAACDALFADLTANLDPETYRNYVLDSCEGPDADAISVYDAYIFSVSVTLKYSYEYYGSGGYFFSSKKEWKAASDSRYSDVTFSQSDGVWTAFINEDGEPTEIMVK